jgi:hypothetical protein
MKNFSQYVKEEIDLRGNPGVPDDFMRKSEEEAERNLGIRRDDPRQMRDLGPEINRLINQSMNMLSTDENGRRLSPQQIEERFTALENLARDVIFDEYGDILDASEKPVELRIRLVRPGRTVTNELPEITQTPSNPQRPQQPEKNEDDEDEEKSCEDGSCETGAGEEREPNDDVLTASHKKKILNMITQGEGKATKDIIRLSETVEQGLGTIFGRRAGEILDIWTRLSDVADKLDWVIPIGDKANMMSQQPQGMAGACDVSWESVNTRRFVNLQYLKENTDFNRIVIKAVGVDFPMLLHESIKGIYLLLQSSAIKKDAELAKAIKRATSSFTDEAQDFRYGVTAQLMFNRFINACAQSDRYPQMRARVFAQMAFDKDRGGRYSDVKFLEIMKSLFSVFDKVTEGRGLFNRGGGRDEFVINQDRFDNSLAKREIESLIADIVRAEDEYREELNKWEMEQRFGGEQSSDDSDETSREEDGDVASAEDNDENDIDSLIRKTAQREENIDPSELTPRELQKLIDDALDAGDYDEVRRLSPYLKEGREIYLNELERINERHISHSRR